MADPVHQHLVAALARRAAAHEGAVRQLLDARLAMLRQAEPPTAADPALPEAGPPRIGRAALAGLLVDIERRRTATSALPSTSMLPYFKRTWSRLNADQRLAQSRSSLPQNAGPLNSQHLVHRSLALMRALSPAYFERFIAYADALLWVEQTNPRDTPRKGPAGRRT